MTVRRRSRKASKSGKTSKSRKVFKSNSAHRRRHSHRFRGDGNKSSAIEDLIDNDEDGNKSSAIDVIKQYLIETDAEYGHVLTVLGELGAEDGVYEYLNQHLPPRDRIKGGLGLYPKLNEIEKPEHLTYRKWYERKCNILGYMVASDMVFASDPAIEAINKDADDMLWQFVNESYKVAYLFAREHKLKKETLLKCVVTNEKNEVIAETVLEGLVESRDFAHPLINLRFKDKVVLTGKKFKKLTFTLTAG